MDFAHTSGTANLVESPHIDGAQTVAMTVATRTVVESGTQTRGQANTAQAYLDGHVAVVTLVTEPGSAHPPLDGGCRRSSRQDRRGGARLMPRSLGTLAQMSNPRVLAALLCVGLVAACGKAESPAPRPISARCRR